jgi:hypothetical protein
MLRRRPRGISGAVMLLVTALSSSRFALICCCSRGIGLFMGADVERTLPLRVTF